MLRRYEEFDLLRVMAMAMIVGCHFLRSIGFYQFDIPLGCVGNMIFFSMSGWLLGLAWRNRGYPVLGWHFLRHRLFRLAVPLWLFAIPYMLAFSVLGCELSWKAVIYNLVLLNWFDRIPGMTPYWFITAIAFFYLTVSLITQAALINEIRRCLVACFVTLTAVGGQVLLSCFGIQYGYILVIYASGLLCFLFSNEILFVFTSKRLSHVPITLLFAIVLCQLFGFWYFVRRGVIIVGTPMCYYATILPAVSIIVLVFRLYGKLGSGKIISFLSSISYEVYLVHAAIILVISSRIDSKMVYFVLYLFLIVSGGFLLHSLSKVVDSNVRGFLK